MILENSPFSIDEKSTDGQDHICIPESYNPITPNFCRHCGIFLSRSLLNGDSNARVCRLEVYSSVFYYANTFQVLQNMYAKQAPNRVYVDNFRHGETRKEMIQIADRLATKLEFSASTLSMAVTFIDSILSNCEAEPRREALLACLALVFAAKIEEKDKKIPSNQNLYYYLSEVYSMPEIEALEMSLFSAFGYNLCVKTSLDFATFFISRGVVNLGEFERTKLLGQTLDLSELESYCNEFLLTMRHLYEMNRFLPAVQAALGISCARNVCGLNPWSDQLEEMTGFAWANLRPIFDFFVDQLRQTLSQTLLLLRMERIGTGRNGEVEVLREVSGLKATKNTSKTRTNAIDKNRVLADRVKIQEDKENLENVNTGNDHQVNGVESEQRRRPVTNRRELSDRKSK